MPCDESWTYCYNPETKRQSSQWKHAGSPRPKKARQSKSTHKILIIPFFTALAWSTCTGFLLDKQSTCWGFKGVQEEIPREEASTLQIGSVAFPPGQWTSPQLHPCHRLFDKMGIKTVPQPPYSPDLAPCDFCLFPKLRGCRYETIGEMKEAVTKVIDTLTQEDFHVSFEKLLERYNKCIAGGWDYFEGDLSFMCVLTIKVPIRKKSRNLFNDPRMSNTWAGSKEKSLRML